MASALNDALTSTITFSLFEILIICIIIQEPAIESNRYMKGFSKDFPRIETNVSQPLSAIRVQSLGHSSLYLTERNPRLF